MFATPPQKKFPASEHTLAQQNALHVFFCWQQVPLHPSAKSDGTM
jgi:hypothetical protein